MCTHSQAFENKNRAMEAAAAARDAEIMAEIHKAGAAAEEALTSANEAAKSVKEVQFGLRF